MSRQSAGESGNVVSPTHRLALPPTKCYQYSFLLQTKTTPKAKSGRKIYVNEKFK